MTFPDISAHSTRTLLVGCGRTATRLGESLVASGGEVVALRRTTNELPASFSALSVDRPPAGWNWCASRCVWRCGNATGPSIRSWPGSSLTIRTREVSHTAVKFTENLALQGITPSIGSVGDAYDNALMESINGLYKTECIGSRIFTPERLESIVEVELATMSWVQWYNNRRLHSTLGMLPPAEDEEAYWAGHATITESSERVAQPI